MKQMMIYLSFTALLLLTGYNIVKGSYNSTLPPLNKELGTLTLKGNIWDSIHGYPIKAKLYVYDVDNGTYSITEAISGKFSITLQLGKTYKLIFSKSAYLSKTIQVLALSPNTIDYKFEFDIYLKKPDSTMQAATLGYQNIAEIYYDKTKNQFAYVKL
jgi:hypothetical protein